MIEMHNVNSKKSFSLARDIDMAGSTCSLASHKSHSHSPTPVTCFLQMIEMHNVNSKKSFSLARDVDMAGSTCSLASHKSHSHSPTPGHSRQNSTASLLEIGLDHPTHGMHLIDID